MPIPLLEGDQIIETGRILGQGEFGIVYQVPTPLPCVFEYKNLAFTYIILSREFLKVADGSSQWKSKRVFVESLQSF